ncbi:hypothetical protein HMPREF1434_00502 [Helicobacter pylori GAMchJs124i]|nr:hypothetical protein HMPREF1405_00101 [Helicobacter pylori GAM231Ai]EMJ44330.1 hypothetical protein HMPREF1434_00502 [Helicobacter pylori GAMchJs124i]
MSILAIIESHTFYKRESVMLGSVKKAVFWGFVFGGVVFRGVNGRARF